MENFTRRGGRWRRRKTPGGRERRKEMTMSQEESSEM